MERDTTYFGEATNTQSISDYLPRWSGAQNRNLQDNWAWLCQRVFALLSVQPLWLHADLVSDAPLPWLCKTSILTWIVGDFQYRDRAQQTLGRVPPCSHPHTPDLTKIAFSPFRQLRRGHTIPARANLTSGQTPSPASLLSILPPASFAPSAVSPPWFSELLSPTSVALALLLQHSGPAVSPLLLQSELSQPAALQLPGIEAKRKQFVVVTLPSIFNFILEVNQEEDVFANRSRDKNVNA